MPLFKTPKELGRGFLLVSGTLILAGLYFVPVFMDLKPDTELFDYLSARVEKFELIYMMLVAYFLKDLKDKIQAYREDKKAENNK